MLKNFYEKIIHVFFLSFDFLLRDIEFNLGNYKTMLRTYSVSRQI